jgi:glycerophosphoryl diester phosphodiesterase
MPGMRTCVSAFSLLVLTAAPRVAPAVEIVAHRGASAAAPENTVAAFRAAWKEGAHAIESDWRLSVDGQVVCMHDATVNRTTNGKGAVDKLSFAELRALDAGQWKGSAWQGERIPTLGEMLALVPRGKRTFIEVKSGPDLVPQVRSGFKPPIGCCLLAARLSDNA